MKHGWDEEQFGTRDPEEKHDNIQNTKLTWKEKYSRLISHLRNFKKKNTSKKTWIRYLHTWLITCWNMGYGLQCQLVKDLRSRKSNHYIKYYYRVSTWSGEKFVSRDISSRVSAMTVIVKAGKKKASSSKKARKFKDKNKFACFANVKPVRLLFPVRRDLEWPSWLSRHRKFHETCACNVEILLYILFTPWMKRTIKSRRRRSKIAEISSASSTESLDKVFKVF